jgi:thiopurine S-methyltransferase
MDASYWHRKWQHNEIAFHEPRANPLLVEHFGALALPAGSRVFVPLCGKTLDIGWLLTQGCRVVGAELSAVAVSQLFEELGLSPKVSSAGRLQHHDGGALEVFVGDIFDLTAALLGHVDASYDRAALVALPADLRPRYAAHLTATTQSAAQLLICYEYDQAAQAGPPFSIDPDEVHRLYQGHYAASLLDTAEVAGGLKGGCAAREHVWLLRPRTRRSAGRT